MDELVYEWVWSVSGIVVDGERELLKEWWFGMLGIGRAWKGVQYSR